MWADFQSWDEFEKNKFDNVASGENNSTAGVVTGQPESMADVSFKMADFNAEECRRP